MNEMRVASMAFAAYLLNSALAQSMSMMGAPGTGERRVELSHQLGRSRSSVPIDDAVRLHEVVDRGALLQELRVADDAERLLGFRAIVLRTFAAVPTGTVLLLTTTL